MNHDLFPSPFLNSIQPSMCLILFLLFLMGMSISELSHSAILHRTDSLLFSKGLQIGGNLIVDNRLVHSGLDSDLRKIESSLPLPCKGSLSMTHLSTGLQYRSNEGTGYFIDGTFYIWRGVMNHEMDGIYEFSPETMNFTHISGEDRYLSPPTRLYFMVFHPSGTGAIYFAEPKPRETAGPNLDTFGQAVWRFHVKTRQWETMNAMPPYRTQKTSVICHSGLFCYSHGGDYADPVTSTMQLTNKLIQYNVRRDSWRNLTRDTSPPYLQQHMVEYFPRSDALLFFGGRNDVLPNLKTFALTNVSDWEADSFRNSDTSTSLRVQELTVQWTVPSEISFDTNTPLNHGAKVFFKDAVYILVARFHGDDHERPIIRLTLDTGVAHYTALYARNQYIQDYINRSTAILFGTHVLLLGGTQSPTVKEDTLGVMNLC